MAPPRIIGLAGYQRAGKTTIADILKAHDYTPLAYADGVREYLLHLNPYLTDAGKYYADVLAEIGYEMAKTSYPSVRKYLVKVGHGARTIMGENVWVDKVARVISSDADTRFVISDVRYKNEADMIKAMGGEIWYIHRPDATGSKIERDTMRMVKIDLVITNDKTIDDLKQLVWGQLVSMGMPAIP